MNKRKSYWDEYILEADEWLAGRRSEPPESPKTERILELALIAKEIDRILSDPRTTTSMPRLYKAVKKALK